VRDVAGVLDVISSPMPGDPYWAPPLPRPLAREVGADPGRLRIGFVDRPPMDGPLAPDGQLADPHCQAAVAAAAGLLESLGHHVEQSSPAALFELEFIKRFQVIIAADTEATFRAFEMFLGRPIGDDEIEPRNAAYRADGREVSAVTYLESRAWLGMWARRMADWWGGHDLLLTPTLGGPPPEIGWFTAAGPEHELERVINFLPYTAQFNMTGQPAVSLPLHWTPGGLPVGVQLIASYGREDLLIRIASQLELAAPWADRHPPVHG
jgi:amidase